MNCTENYFIAEVRAKYPHKYVHYDIQPATTTIFMLDTKAESNNSYTWKMRNASHIWQSGCVIKDRYGIFPTITPFTAAPHITTISGATSYSTHSYTLPTLEDPPKLDFNQEPCLDRCECGAEACGSSRHSNWCKLHNKETA
jgi:hypothetical protein